MAANQNIYKMCQSYPDEQHDPMDNNELSAFNLLNGIIGIPIEIITNKFEEFATYVSFPEQRGVPTGG